MFKENSSLKYNNYKNLIVEHHIRNPLTDITLKSDDDKKNNKIIKKKMKTFIFPSVIDKKWSTKFLR